MAVRNGAADLQAQLDSLVAQTHANWALVASDDGSTDDSRAILQRFAGDQAARHPVVVAEGPGRGFVRNFLSLLARPGLSGPVALCDQDDIWFPDRLERALARLAALPPDRPALYCSRRVNWWP
ncbi:MAG: glycosyltransferase, partial [Gemmobacter sp.]